MLDVITFMLGPVATNTYLVADPETQEAAVIDPACDEPLLVMEAERRGWKIRQLWITHAHFDHFGGAAGLVSRLEPALLVALHPLDQKLWQSGGGAALFGMQIPLPPEVTLPLAHRQVLALGKVKFEVRHLPGHSPGHVVFYCAEESLVFCGDTIFWGSVGRTDLPGGDEPTLLKYIQERILTLPDETRLLPGHGDETTVGQEKRWNPFLS